MQKIVLRVKGMHCSSCEELIQDALREAGIAYAKADHRTGKVIVEHETPLTPDRIGWIIADEGYEVES